MYRRLENGTFNIDELPPAQAVALVNELERLGVTAEDLGEPLPSEEPEAEPRPAARSGPQEPSKRKQRKARKGKKRR